MNEEMSAAGLVTCPSHSFSERRGKGSICFCLSGFPPKAEPYFGVLCRPLFLQPSASKFQILIALICAPGQKGGESVKLEGVSNFGLDK